jgi:hypothetical protein
VRLLIIDSGIRGRCGHNFAFASLIAEEARRRGIETLAWCHQDFGHGEGLPFAPFPIFSSSYYDLVSADPVTGRWQTYNALNDEFHAQLCAAPIADIGAGGLVLVPTIAESQFDGLLRWIEGLDRADLTFVILLMLPSGAAIEGESFIVYDSLQALYYRLLLQRAARLGPNVHLLATGMRFSRDYSFLAERPVPSHPLLVDSETSLAPPAGKTILLHAGDAVDRKGLRLLPQLVRLLSAELPDWNLLIHANASAEGSNKLAVAELCELAKAIPALELLTGYLGPAAYRQLFSDCAIVAMPYDSASYRRLSSGVLWESIAAGRPVLVPGGTCLEREARDWGAEYRGIDTMSAETMAAAIVASLGSMDMGRAVEAAKRFRAVNGVGRFLDRLLELRSRP